MGVFAPMNGALVISKGSLQKDQLSGKIALITGAGGGIGFEAARSLIWLGTKVIIVDIDKNKGKTAEAKLNKEFGPNSSMFIGADIGNERQVKSLAKKVHKSYGHVDIIFNNATVAPIGAVHKVGIKKWDLSYRTNLRGPVLLLEYFLPKMLERNHGVIAFVPSSGAAPYMGAYEVFKTSQVELSNTLSGELEGTGVITYSIGPGIVKTDTAMKAISEIAPLYGKSEDEFYKMSEHVLLTVEEAGAGFAASVALANNYSGLETSSSQALTDIGVVFQDQNEDTNIIYQTDTNSSMLEVLHEIKKTFSEQVDGWKSRPVFERQWVLRDFKKYTGAAPEYFIDRLKEFDERAQSNELSKSAIKELPVDKIAIYYKHQIDLLRGYEKNPEKVKEYSELMENWIDSIERFKEIVREIIE
jgi:NAD(P)-dependent dehydrogenase (short-subunit alcohol dehydrogenase family)